jgi:hypothetical protein
MKFITVILLFSLCSKQGQCQFSPAAGVAGSTAIYADSAVFVNWASHCYINRGLRDIAQPDSGFVSYGSEQDALGKADNNAVSLGDSGVAVLTFPNPICNKDGYDFAVFENAFNDDFLELAFVEISSDSMHWFRFPSISLTQTEQQIETFGTLHTEKINNLAGKYRVMYGTPFEIDEIPDNPYLNKQQINYVKIIDVIGTMDSLHASHDSQGHIINDPYPTPFTTGGFDLDAVGVIHQCPNNVISEELSQVCIYPNPFKSEIYFNAPDKIINVQLFNLLGKEIIVEQNINSMNTSMLSNGSYIIKITTTHQTVNQLIIKK